MRLLAMFLSWMLVSGTAGGANRTADSSSEFKRLENAAARVTVVRDSWGIAHVTGASDADAVFGAIYAQAEDDFRRVETNVLIALGRLAEADGEKAIWRDLRAKLFANPEVLKAEYKSSPKWLRKLMTSWADGLNFYLAKHPEVAPRVIRHFEPWMTLAAPEGSVDSQVERISVSKLEAFYAGRTDTASTALDEPDDSTGSNGIAVAPSRTRDGRALLLINPHTPFYFRSELQMTSQEGLNAYGAVTWGQFFVFQGFNDRVGWMHTATTGNNSSEYLETVVKKGDRYLYKYGKEERPLATTPIRVPYRTNSGIKERVFTVFSTHHGPVVKSLEDRWVSVRLMQERVKALSQSFLRTKAKSYRAFRHTLNLRANASGNTIYADRNGNIAFFHANFMPKRNPRFDWTKPVDGSDSATEWKGLHSVQETPHLLNPSAGWLFNSNNSPWSSSGASSLKKAKYPGYMDLGAENARGLHLARLLEKKKDFTLESLKAAAFDTQLNGFEGMLPALFQAWEKTTEIKLKVKLSDQIARLRSWDRRWSIQSVPTALAVLWFWEILSRYQAANNSEGLSLEAYVSKRASPEELLGAMAAASDRIEGSFGSWQTPWGEINRFQRLTGDLDPVFSDDAPSFPVGFTFSELGSLSTFGAYRYRDSKRLYGTRGNSFVAVVEFGKRVRAWAISAGGANGDPSSLHFNDQSALFARGDLREVYFYPSQLRGRTERSYCPGR